MFIFQKKYRNVQTHSLSEKRFSDNLIGFKQQYKTDLSENQTETDFPHKKQIINKKRTILSSPWTEFHHNPPRHLVNLRSTICNPRNGFQTEINPNSLELLRRKKAFTFFKNNITENKSREESNLPMREEEEEGEEALGGCSLSSCL